VVVGANPQPPHVRFSSPGKGLLSSPCQGCSAMNRGETWTIEDQNRQQVRMDVQAGSLTGQALPRFRSPAGSVEDPAPPGTAFHTVPEPSRCPSGRHTWAGVLVTFQG
jgi:hypothetical protein